MSEPTVRFAAIGLNHDHIYMQADRMIASGGAMVAFHEQDDALAARFAAHYPDARRVADRAAILEDRTIALVLTAAVPADRAALGIEAMRHGKDVMTDKPGATTLEQLADLRRVQAETGRIYSIYYEERLENPVTLRACQLVAEGAIGRFVHSIGTGPHLVRKDTRPPWFFERARTGGILTDLASHQCDGFLTLAGTLDVAVAMASVDKRANPEAPELQDVGEIMLRSPEASGYVRVDWFTPQGLPVFGDCRLFVVGTEGTLEVRKYIDAGRDGVEPILLLADRNGVRAVDVGHVEPTYGHQLVADIRDRTETAMSQAHCFKAMELALTAQSLAEAGRAVGSP